MSQSNFDPNQDPYQQNPQPNQGHQPYPPGYDPQQPGQGYPQPGYGQPVYVIQQPTDVNNMAMLAHLSGIAGFLIPLIFWAVYKDKPGYERVRSAAARTFNLGVTLAIIIFGSFLLLVLLMVISLIIGAQSQSGEPFMLFFTMFPILWLLIAGLGVTAVVFHIIGAVKANSGEDYKYPLPTIPMLR